RSFALVGVVDFLELGIHHIALSTALARIGTRFLRLLGGSLGVEFLRQCRRSGRQLGGGGLDGLLVVAFERSVNLGQRGFDRSPLLGSGLVTCFLQGLARGVRQAIGLIARLHQFLELAVGIGVGLGVLDHLLYFF